MLFLCGTARLSGVGLSDYTVLGRWAMSSLCGTARLSCVYLRCLHC